MKIHILYNFQPGSWGGGNQFLKVLKKEFMKKGIYEKSPEKAEVILFNSYPFGAEYFFNQILNLKQKYPNKIVIYRLDGPVSLVRGKDGEIDKMIALFNKIFADGIIFQSNWCREKNKNLFKILSEYKTVIHNATDKEIFNRYNKEEFSPDRKIKLIATSWSSNWQKGFDVYKYLDENLDFSKYEMTFVGNSPIEFKNINWVKPVSSEKLAQILKAHDIYITASQNDPCSNSLIEASSCGLPTVALNNGGHPELAQNWGELFEEKEDIVEEIEKIVKNYHYYQSRIPEFSIVKVAEKYYEFAEKIYRDVQQARHRPKRVSFLTKINFLKIKFMILKWKIINKIETIRKT